MATWPPLVTRGLERQAALSAHVSRSLRWVLAFAAAATLLYPALLALIDSSALLWSIAVCGGNLLAATVMWNRRVRFLWPWPPLRDTPESDGSPWGAALAGNDLRVHTQVAMFGVIIRMLGLMAVWTSGVTLGRVAASIL